MPKKITPPTIVKKELDDRHFYFINGEYFPGVTSIIEQAGPTPRQLKDYFINNSRETIEKKSQESLEFGSKIHNAIEGLLMGEKINLREDFKKDREKRYMMSFYNWYQIVKPVDHIAEHPIASVSMKYAGTLDFAGWIKPENAVKALTPTAAKAFKPVRKDQEFWIVDFKTSAGIYESYAWQIAAYKKAYEEMYNVKVDHVAICRLGTAHKNRFEFVEFPYEQNLKTFQRIYDIYIDMNGGHIPEPPLIDAYPEELQLYEQTVGGE